MTSRLPVMKENTRKRQTQLLIFCRSGVMLYKISKRPLQHYPSGLCNTVTCAAIAILAMLLGLQVACIYPKVAHQSKIMIIPHETYTRILVRFRLPSDSQHVDTGCSAATTYVP